MMEDDLIEDNSLGGDGGQELPNIAEAIEDVSTDGELSPENNPEGVEEKPSFRQKYMKARGRDTDWESDEEFEGDVLGQMESINGFVSFFQKLLRENPDIAEALKLWKADPSIDFNVHLASIVDPTEFFPQEGDENYEAYTTAKNHRVSRRDEFDRMSSEYDQNAKESVAVLDTWASEKGLSDDQVAEFLNTVIQPAMDMFNRYKLDPQLLDLFFKGSQYDTDVAEAEEMGAISGRNENITAKMDAEDSTPLPNIDGGGGEEIIEESKKSTLAEHIMPMANRINNAY